MVSLPALPCCPQLCEQSSSSTLHRWTSRSRQCCQKTNNRSSQRGFLLCNIGKGLHGKRLDNPAPIIKESYQGLDDNPALVKKQLRAGKPWEPEALELFSKYAVPGSTALDIGAHIGSLTLPLARSVRPDGMVYAFEPQKKIYRELVKNLELNNVKNAVPLRFAVGAQHLVIEMTPTQGRDGTMQVGAGGDKAEMRSIDSFVFSNVSMMKIDVEGYELPVLKGAKRTIQKWHPAILIEIPGFYHSKTLPPNQKEQIDGVRSFFEQNGYRLRFAYDAGEPHFLALHKQNQ